MPNSVPDNHELDKRLTVAEIALQNLGNELKQINNNLNKLVWVIVLAIVTAIMQFILSGGLHRV